MTQTSFTFIDNEYEIKPWDKLGNLAEHFHDQKFLKILKKHGFDENILPVPLRTRYTKGRRWSADEFNSCFDAWIRGVSLTLISANLNRNPQDMIYKLIDECNRKSITFTQKGRSESSVNWSKEVETCASELFGLGLPAWKIAVIFQVDFEFVEKKVFKDRQGYGHVKKNPFTINTDHKQLVNKQVLDKIQLSDFRVLEPFAGEGRFTKIILSKKQVTSVVCIEENESTFEKLSNIGDPRCRKILGNNIKILKQIEEKFDLIDLDPFSSCHEQIDLIWKNFKEDAYLFLTFGGEYRRSFITSNRKSMLERYQYNDTESSNSNYLEEAPHYFMGNIAKRSCSNGYEFQVLKAVRYANYCRFWLKLEKSKDPSDWYRKSVIENQNGQRFINLNIPRFKEIRHEIDHAKKEGFNL